MAKNLRTDAARRVAKEQGAPKDRWRAELTAHEGGTSSAPLKAQSGEVNRPNRRKKHLGSDPYNHIKPLERRSTPQHKPRSLDDMRGLNEEIKSAQRKLNKLVADFDVLIAVRAKAYAYAEKWAAKGLAYRNAGKAEKAKAAEAHVCAWLGKIKKLESQAALGKRKAGRGADVGGD